jgi:hypothetical protein
MLMVKRWLLLIILVLGLGASLISAQGVAALEYGVPVSGEFTEEQPSQTYTFAGTAGEVIYITLLSPTDEIDAEMRLLDPNNLLVTEADYGGASQIIGPVTLSLDGNYTILAEQANVGESSGDYSIMVDSAVFTPLEMDGEISGQLDNSNTTLFFTFAVDAGDLARIAMVGESVGFVLFSPFGGYVLSEGYYNDPEISLYQFEESGTFTLYAQTINESGSDYSLMVDLIVPISLTSGQAATGDITSGEPMFFAFESLLGKTWQINATLPDSGDRYMTVFQLDEREWWDTILVGDYGSGPNGNPRIAPFIAPANTTYYVSLWFESWEGEDSAPYEISLSPSTVFSLAPGTEISESVSAQSGDMTYVYNGAAGEVVRITMRRLSEAGALALSIYSPETEVVAFYSYSVDSASFEVTLPFDSVYQFVVSNVAYDDLDMDFSLLLEEIPQ